MKRILQRFIGGLKGAAVVTFAFLLLPMARLFLWRKKIWLVSEHGFEARDNGYSFFKYMRKEHPEVNCFYAIDFNSTDYPKIKDLGNEVKFGSFKHFAYWCAARYIISSKTQGFCPSYYLTLLRKRMHLWGKYVFLQHGITKDDQKFLYKKPSKIDLFICGAKPEYDDIKSHYGYGEKEVVYTGFARFDDYFKLSPKKQILVMPTWRRYTDNVNFIETEYYQTWLSFLNSPKLNKILRNSDYVLNFYLHPQFKDFTHLFNVDSPNIKIIPFDNSDFQSIIRESAIFITDFSSLAFDFGFMNRAVIYYQYDEKKYFQGHYIKGYFDYRRDGFGPVVSTLDDVVLTLSKLFEKDLSINDKYALNSARFFPKRDANNSRRIYEAIKDLK